MKEKISLALARRIAVAAQGLAEPRPAGPITRRHLTKVLDRLGLLQIDSVSAVVRAHYMPLFSRLGPYPMSLLDDAASPGRKRALFEYWAHEASLLPLEAWPLMRWRMERASRNEEIYGGLARWAEANGRMINEIYRRVADNGPTAASDIDGAKGKGGWWGWSDEKHAFEWLFWAGRLTTAARRGFERLYDVPERVIPGKVLNLPEPAPADAHRELLRLAARALGIATASDLRDYYRLSPSDMKGRIEELVESGDILPVSVEGWRQQAYLYAGARLKRKVEARALLAPFDPLVWERARAERLFDFRYRIEIYTPAEKRQYGYYVMPFLLGDTVVARIDLRADRPTGVLRAMAAYAEPGAPRHTAETLAGELDTMRAWLGLERLEILPAGDLGPALLDAADGSPALTRSAAEA
ncbi:YcaQ family DNA glycosylase [Pseudaminobacter sp. 19-2017]|uniref:YcaQ family DNA glycosylase n=1 Tax=Pseudaminobacter soli (ex Zhang et al. 2022) TaxID=2831468 RepID=A0A942E1F9_9HYPH|nr:winged helix-turn-helix domain-containing protein [Pseudaminobacter soli]MBS3649271.1 YcaQ family DNA glycosylase [Pseudaminobacter soli]